MCVYVLCVHENENIYTTFGFNFQLDPYIFTCCGAGVYRNRWLGGSGAFAEHMLIYVEVEENEPEYV